jgi:hypothetical protein
MMGERFAPESVIIPSKPWLSLTIRARCMRSRSEAHLHPAQNAAFESFCSFVMLTSSTSAIIPLSLSLSLFSSELSSFPYMMSETDSAILLDFVALFGVFRKHL